MKTRISIALLLVVSIASIADAQNRRYRRRGAILGGLAGAAIGAAIGDKGDNETAGALIGGAVGAVAGGTIGDQKDKRIEHNYRYHSGRGHYTHPHARYPQGQVPPYYQPRYYGPGTTTPVQPQPAVVLPPPPTSPTIGESTEQVIRPVTPQDVVAMVQGGLSEPMIIQQIQILGASQVLSISDVIQLHRMGVSEPIISAMQAAAPVATVQSEKPEPETFGPSILVPAR